MCINRYQERQTAIAFLREGLLLPIIIHPLFSNIHQVNQKRLTLSSDLENYLMGRRNSCL